MTNSREVHIVPFLWKARKGLNYNKQDVFVKYYVPGGVIRGRRVEVKVTRRRTLTSFKDTDEENMLSKLMKIVPCTAQILQARIRFVYRRTDILTYNNMPLFIPSSRVQTYAYL